MEVEQFEIFAFLKQYPPFSLLPEDKLKEIAPLIEVAYYREGQEILSLGEPSTDLYLVRSGMVELYRRNGDLFYRMDVGDVFGQMGLLMNRKVRYPAKAIEDTLLYCLPADSFDQLFQGFDDFADFVEIEDSQRVRKAVSNGESSSGFSKIKISKLISRPPVIIPAEKTIQQVANIMTEENVRVVLVSLANDDDSDANGKIGIVTDRDFCTKAIAEGKSLLAPIEEIITPDVITVNHNMLLPEAVLTMLSNHLNHLVVLKDNEVIGVIGLNEIVQYQSSNSLLLVNAIFQQKTVDDLILLSAQLKDAFLHLVNEKTSVQILGNSISALGRAFKQRLAQLAEKQLGPPPVPYCLIALGSMARDEQLILTDQDNALILSNKYNEVLHGEYFAKFADIVCDGLAACGYRYCKGGIMASNPEWRKTRSQWEACFADWISQPSPKKLLDSSIFFDLLGVYGRNKWAESLMSFIARQAKKNKHFLACLAYNAVMRKPPLGFFKDFVMEKNGKQKPSINLKRRATAPFVDLIRVHALSVGSQAQNSFNRLDDVIDAGILPSGRGQDLRDALELIYRVRIRHQAIYAEADETIANSVEPENMSDFEKRSLKDAFQILSNAQSYIKYRYQRH